MQEKSDLVLSSADPIMQLINAHEAAGSGSFHYGVAQRATGNPELHHMAAPRRYQGDGTLGAIIGKTEETNLMKQHISKPMHDVFFKHSRDNQLSKKLTFACLKLSGKKPFLDGGILGCISRWSGEYTRRQ